MTQKSYVDKIEFLCDMVKKNGNEWYQDNRALKLHKMVQGVKKIIEPFSI